MKPSSYIFIVISLAGAAGNFLLFADSGDFINLLAVIACLLLVPFIIYSDRHTPPVR